ncbi:hypothetical protein HYPDE_40818 [Hyphomicrobium denitrificans 1NES1]|uniref:Uncharacterized protein n=1 Tax=Hyphomicrobium denitrificans 1NES1 TaxID=670307 RepID=N0BC48_9HYPH|nr:hypothetical protein HYPDE_40818 [Hyphomicrobium denitrificans 1NES1]
MTIEIAVRTFLRAKRPMHVDAKGRQLALRAFRIAGDRTGRFVIKSAIASLFSPPPRVERIPRLSLLPSPLRGGGRGGGDVPGGGGGDVPAFFVAAAHS